MKYLIPLIFIYGCTPKDESINVERSFPIYVTLGPDLSFKKGDSVACISYESYLPTCGVSPDYEAPNMGAEVYQISGKQASIGWTTYSGKTIPYFTDLSRGSYTFVAHAYIEGYRECDQTYQNQHAYDTLNLTIRNGRR